MILNMPSCGGCRTCEMACSFKHSGEFVPSISSIKIINKENGVGHSIHLFERKDERTMPCDGCVELETPLCVLHCIKGEDLKKILKQFMRKRKRAGPKKQRK
jgi:Fe-S-cluster-containing hydrogenase component 2